MVTETLIRSMYAYWRKSWDYDLDEQRMRLLLQLEVDQLNAAYAAALDEKRFDDWPEFFVEDGRYTVQARENFDRGLPLALMALESRGMMKDRVYGVTQTIYHRPYYTRHVVGPARCWLAQEGDAGGIKAQAQLRGVPHQAGRCERGLQRGPLHRRAHAKRRLC
jgi:hypothetical protein